MENTILKTCSVCGLQKPISAFLQLAGAEGTTYGNVCADCRKTYLEQKRKQKEHDDHTTSTSGKTIDSKARVAEDIDKKEERQQKKETDLKEGKKAEEKKSTVSKKEEVAKFEKKQRESFLKKRTFITTQKIEKPKTGDESEQQRQAAEETYNAEHVEKKAEATKGDQQKTEISLDVPFIDTQITGKIKYTGRFQEFKQWIGKGSAIGKTAGDIEKKNNTKNKDETPEELTEKNLAPKTRR